MAQAEFPPTRKSWLTLKPLPWVKGQRLVSVRPGEDAAWTWLEGEALHWKITICMYVYIYIHKCAFSVYIPYITHHDCFFCLYIPKWLVMSVGSQLPSDCTSSSSAWAFMAETKASSQPAWPWHAHGVPPKNMRGDMPKEHQHWWSYYSHKSWICAVY